MPAGAEHRRNRGSVGAPDRVPRHNPSTEIGIAFQSGYDPMKSVGEVTARDGRRLIEIAGQPAAEWYHEATGGNVFSDPHAEASILAPSTAHPLGRQRGEVDGVTTYLLVHPAAVHADGSMSTFATVQEGEHLRVMSGTLESLTTRASRVAKDALAVSDIEPGDLAGALVVYCGGCMLHVGDALPRVLEGLSQALGAVPFIGTYTFGEAGQLDDESHHGNLMISVVVFEKSP